MRLELTATLLASAIVCVPARAQHADSVRASAPVAPIARAARRVGNIEIDGSLDDSAWRAATPITGAAAVSADTRARLRPCPPRFACSTMMRRSTLARACSSRGARTGVRAPLARRDQLLDGNGNNGTFNSLTTDKLIVVLDPYHNHRDEALFEVNPAGVRGDQLNGDQGWDPIWTAATKIDSQGWTAEMRIPYSQLRFSRDSVQLWGMQIWRYEDRLNERDMWSFWRKSDAGGPAYFGTVEGIRIGERPRQLEILPYVLTGEQTAARRRRATPFTEATTRAFARAAT